jgi:Family of unknown function (DUF6510)
VHTDGNAIAGLLASSFGRDMTAEQRVCQSCGTRSAIGAHRLYWGAGLVLRCPVCSDVAACFASFGEMRSMTLYGRWLYSESPTSADGPAL